MIPRSYLVPLITTIHLCRLLTETTTPVGTTPSLMDNEVKTYKIHLCDLSATAKYMHEPKTGRYELLGRIFHPAGYEVTVRTTVPSDLNVVLSPFTIQIRRTVITSATRIAIMQLTSLPPGPQVAAANKIL